MILIGADFVPTKTNYDLFTAGDSRRLFGERLEELLTQADYRILNLETPLCDSLSPINKCGANFAAPVSCVNGYIAAHTDLLTLANNHIMDQGVPGLESTLRALDDAGIAHVGVGENLSDAAEPHLFSYGDKTVGVYACAEHEFSIAGKDTPGANPFDPLETPDHIARLKSECDYLIVLYHGGKEYYRYPSPMLQKTCRKLVDKGADLVVCQHSHCVGCEEQYGGGTIVYGQGNFLFDITEREEFQTSVLICIDDDFRLSYYPIVRVQNTVRPAEGEKAAEIIDGFDRRSREILQEGFVEARFTEFARTLTDHYLFSVSGRHSPLFRIGNRLSGGRLKNRVARSYETSQLTELQNYMECESIRELIAAGLRDRIGS
jgi:poly-gamma-glutamate synthesis protein (capsule biosynthesis protein)